MSRASSTFPWTFQTLTLLLSPHPSPSTRQSLEPWLGGLFASFALKAGQVLPALLPGRKDHLSHKYTGEASSLPKELSEVWSCPSHNYTWIPSILLCDKIIQHPRVIPMTTAKVDLPQVLNVLCRTFLTTGAEVIFCWFPIQHHRQARGRLRKAYERQLNEYTVPSNCDSIISSHYSNRNKSFSSQPYYLTQRQMVCNPVRAGLLLDTF